MISDEARGLISAAANERVRTWKPCALCGATDWAFNDGYSVIGTFDDLKGNVAFPEKFQPAIALHCQNCGDTHLLNLLLLGLDHLVAELKGEVGSDA